MSLASFSAIFFINQKIQIIEDCGNNENSLQQTNILQVSTELRNHYVIYQEFLKYRSFLSIRILPTAKWLSDKATLTKCSSTQAAMR